MTISEAETMPEPQCEIEPVGPAEIARRLGVAFGTVRTWNFDRVLPPPRWHVGRGPLWDWSEIEDWAVATGRLDPSKTTSASRRRQEEPGPELVGAGEIAERLGLGHRAVLKRIMRGQIPPPRWQVAGRGVWLWEDLKELPANRRITH